MSDFTTDEYRDMTRKFLTDMLSEEADASSYRKERSMLSEQMSLGQRGRGLIDDTMAERAKTLMTHLYNNAINDFIAEEGLMEDEAEEMAVAAVVEVVKEFLDSVGYRHYLDRS